MWTYGNVRIIVTEKSDEKKQVIARLQPIQGTTVHQTLGHEGLITKLTGFVVGFTEKEHLETLPASGIAYNLTGYGKDYGDFFPSNFTFEHTHTVVQTIRTDLDCDEPVFSFTAELFKDV